MVVVAEWQCKQGCHYQRPGSHEIPNFQGAMVFDAGGHNQRGNRDIPAGPLFGSDEWNELFVFALDEAKRLGLEIGFNIQSGWNLGGPRVTPEYTAKQITFSEAKVSGSKNVSLKLKMPNTRRDFYEDIAVLAFPIVEQQKTDETITYLDLKLGFHELGGSAPDTRFLLTNTLRNNATMADNSSYIVKKDDILGIFCRNPCQSADYLVGAAVRAVYRLHAPHTIRRSGGQVCCRCTLLLWRPCAECVPA